MTGKNFVVDAHGTGGIDGNGQVTYTCSNRLTFRKLTRFLQPWWEYFQNHTREDGDGRPLSLTLYETQNAVVRNFYIQSPPFWCNCVANSDGVVYDGMTCNATNSNPAYFGKKSVFHVFRSIILANRDSTALFRTQMVLPFACVSLQLAGH